MTLKNGADTGECLESEIHECQGQRARINGKKFLVA